MEVPTGKFLILMSCMHWTANDNPTYVNVLWPCPECKTDRPVSHVAVRYTGPVNVFYEDASP